MLPFDIDGDSFIMGAAIGAAIGAQFIVYFFHLVVRCKNCCQFNEETK